MLVSGRSWTRPIGTTGLTTTAVCVGGSPLGSMPTTYGYAVDADAAIELVGAVLASPIRTIDTSNGYSDGESERRIGAAIARNGGLPDDFLVITKVDAKDADYSGERVRQSVRESKERLGLDVLPLVHLHDPETHRFEDLTAPGGAVDALVELREAGEIGHIGLAGGPVQEMSRYLELGVFEVLLVHNRWTLVDRSAGDIIARAHDLGAAVVNAAIYGGGILANPVGVTRYCYQPAPQPLLDAVANMVRLCDEFGTTLATAALQFSLRDSQFATTIVGVSKADRLAGILAAAEVDLSEEFWQRLEELVPSRQNWLDFR